MKIAVQMDPLNTIDCGGDSSWMMILEALRRGYDVFHYHPDGLSMRTQTQGTASRISARMVRLTMTKEALGGTPLLSDLQQSAAEIYDLAEFDVILMRQDPPFDMHYLSATYILERLPSSVLIVNNPAEVRNAPEKIISMDFPDLMPPTLISSDPKALADFRHFHQDVIAKPLYGNGGAGIFHLRPEDDNLSSLLEMHQQFSHTPLQMQKFLPAVKLGDKRILMIDGNPVGAIDRLPGQGEVRANMHVGGTAKAAGYSKRDLEICEAIKETLVSLGMIFVGIDIIGGYLTEINVTSPTGIQEINRFDQVCIEAQLWDSIERHKN